MEPVGVVRGADIKKALEGKNRIHSHGCSRGGKMKSWPLWTPRPSLEFHEAHVPFKIPLDR